MSTTPGKVKVTKVADFDVDLPEYDVTVDGEHIGTVHKAWFRNGGTQWTHGAHPGGLGSTAGRTRATAVRHLLASKGIEA